MVSEADTDQKQAIVDPLLFPDTVTEPCLVFVRTIVQATTFLQDFFWRSFGFDLMVFSSFVKYLEDHPEDLPDGVTSSEEINAYAHREINANMKTSELIMDTHGLFILQTMLSRGYDAFLVYLGDVLSLIHANWSAEISLSDERSGTYVSGLLQKHRDTITGAFKKLDVFREFNTNLALPLFKDDAGASKERRISALRNIIAHNNGVADVKFIEQLTTSFPAESEYFPDPPKLGQPIMLRIADVHNDLEFLSRLVFDLDQRASRKYSLPQRKAPTNTQEAAAQDAEGVPSPTP